MPGKPKAQCVCLRAQKTEPPRKRVIIGGWTSSPKSHVRGTPHICWYAKEVSRGG